MPVSPSQLIESLKWRYATKKFDNTKKISAKDWQTLEEALILSPSSYGLQPWKFLVITDPATRKKLTPLSWNQTQVEDCSHYVVFLGRNSMDEDYISKFIQTTADARGMQASVLDGYKNMMIGDLVKGPRSKIIGEWAARQVYIALGNFMTCAAMLGVDACPMEGIDPPKYDEVLDLKKTGYHTLVACAAGYRSKEDKHGTAAKVRFGAKDLIVHI